MMLDVGNADGTLRRLSESYRYKINIRKHFIYEVWHTRLDVKRLWKLHIRKLLK